MKIPMDEIFGRVNETIALMLAGDEEEWAGRIFPSSDEVAGMSDDDQKEYLLIVIGHLVTVSHDIIKGFAVCAEADSFDLWATYVKSRN